MGKDKNKDAEAAAPAGPPGPPGPPKPREPQYGEDGELLGGPHTMQQQAAQRRLQQTQAQVDEVVDIMKTNMDKVLERDHLLTDLSERAEALEDGASAFKSQAASLKNKFWLENLKMMIVMGVIGLIIIGILYVRYSGGDTPAVVQAAPAAPAVVAPPADSTAAPAVPAAGKFCSVVVCLLCAVKYDKGLLQRRRQADFISKLSGRISKLRISRRRERNGGCSTDKSEALKLKKKKNDRGRY